MLTSALLLILAADLSTYRQFHFGMDLPAATKQSGLTAPDSKVITRRPALVETLEWQPQRAALPNSVENVVLTFYNDQLFRMVINYQRLRTEGMTTEDMIDSISSTYGTPTRPDVTVVLPSYNDEKVKVLARWEDADYSLNLVHSFMASYTLIAVSKPLEASALSALAESLKLDREEAPAKELLRNEKEATDAKAALDKARVANKAGFRP
jgi:hypothetical protein